ncbi:peptidase M13 [Altererythrobacter salegens]|uniref:Peptidase M13 n=1 Tax=Croceibacterium salegens TaxID=1737568 RepID=A0A6I4SW19_9SPHN|nr:M13 family metallopeptidase [Croceibacterium salegens]MXO59237.1 peptidase M13 [Croceibacterium salegens]
MIRQPFAFAAASALALSLAAPALAQDAPASNDGDDIVVTAHAAIGDYGLDLTGLDPTAKPGDDFERYASGGWMDRTTIPDDKASSDMFNVLSDGIEEQVRTIIQGYPVSAKAGALYKSFVDEKALEKVGLAPLMRDVNEVRTLADKAALARYMGKTNGAFGISLFNPGVDVDPDDPTMNLLNLSQGGLGLPDKSYYLADSFAPQRKAYVEYMTRTFKALGEKDPVAAAAAVMEFETYVAQLSWDRADRRDIDKTNNPYSSAELASLAPNFDWDAFFAGAGIPAQKKLIVAENTAFPRLANLFESTPLETLKLWEAFHVADQASPYLNKAMVDSRFAYTSSLSGVAQNRERWKRGVSLVNSQLGYIVGQDYVDKHFPPIAKAKMEDLVANLKLAMADRIKANSWMSDATKKEALAKLENTLVMVGYPDEWRDYSKVSISPTDLYGNVSATTAFNTAYQMDKVGKPVDRKEWFMAPQVVNAYNAGQLNEIVFPAGILQPPFFDAAADPAVNYGAIGVVIGHEISHSFDDQGRKIDAKGAVRDWWTAEDAARFNAEAKKFGEQYAAFEVVPGANINPDLTMGENIADFAGLNVALDAYHRSLNGQPAPVIDGLTGDQRFFLAYAQIWRDKTRDDALRNQVATDPHSPARYRVIVPLRDLDAWYEAFNIQPGDAMYIPPEQRVHIW